MRKKDYELIASVLKRCTEWASPVNKTDRARLAMGLAEAFEQVNPRFDREKFLIACGVK